MVSGGHEQRFGRGLAYGASATAPLDERSSGNLDVHAGLHIWLR